MLKPCGKYRSDLESQTTGRCPPLQMVTLLYGAHLGYRIVSARSASKHARIRRGNTWELIAFSLPGSLAIRWIDVLF
jgi:hypothetical protein